MHLFYFSVRSRNINFHGIGDRHARDHGEKLRGEHLNRSSHPPSFVYIPTDALSFCQFPSKFFIYLSLTASLAWFSGPERSLFIRTWFEFNSTFVYGCNFFLSISQLSFFDPQNFCSFGNFLFTIKKYHLNDVWMSWNLVRLHEILKQMLKISAFYLDKQKKNIPKKILTDHVHTMDSSFFSQQMAPWRPNFPNPRLWVFAPKAVIFLRKSFGQIALSFETNALCTCFLLYVYSIDFQEKH